MGEKPHGKKALDFKYEKEKRIGFGKLREIT